VSSELTLQDLNERLSHIEDQFNALQETVSRISATLGQWPSQLERPEPIAYSLAREQSAALYTERFHCLLDAGEACIRYTAALALALMSNASDRAALLGALGGQPVALGKWAALVDRSLVLLQGSQPDTAVDVWQSLLESLVRPNGKRTPAARFMLVELVQVRNTEKGHGSAKTEGVYEGLYYRHASALHDALRDLTFLRFPMVCIEDIDVAGECTRYAVRVLMNPYPIGRIEGVLSGSRVRKGETCIWDRAQGLLSLGGLVIYQTCPECQLEHTFFLEQATSDRTRYSSYAGNHRFQGAPLGWASQSV